MVEETIKEEISQDGAENQVYEVGFHVVPSLEEANLGIEVDAIKSLIKDNGGVFIADESPKLINLAYTISKDIDSKRYRFDTAYFGWIKFEMNTDKIMNVKNGIDLNKNILRYLIIKTVKESTLAPKTAFAKDDTHKKHKLKKPEISDKTDKKEKPKSTPVLISEEELDKTIEELIVE